MSRILFGKVWNAKKCTFDGRDYWLACFLGSGGRFQAKDICNEGFKTSEEASEWLLQEAAQRGMFNSSDELVFSIQRHAYQVDERYLVKPSVVPSFEIIRVTHGETQIR